MKKWLIVLSLLLVATGLLLTGCGKSGEGPTGTGILQGNVSYCDFDQEPDLTTDANNALVTMTGTGLPSRSTHTNISGDYLINNIVAGTYTVIADYSLVTNKYSFPYNYAEKYYRENAGGLTFTGTLSGKDNIENATISVSNVTITDGTTTNLDFQLWGY